MDEIKPGARVIVSNSHGDAVALVEDIRAVNEMPASDRRAALDAMGATRAAVLSYYILPERFDTFNAFEVGGCWFDSHGRALDLEPCFIP